MEAGRVCPHCEHDDDEVWPALHDYVTCPRCGKYTKYTPDTDPMSPDEARRVILHITFDRDYARREAARDAEAFAALEREIAALPETVEPEPARPRPPLFMRWDRGL